MNISELNEAIEKQIESEKKEFEFDIREYPLQFLQSQFNPPLGSGKEADLYIPDYQREFVWSEKQQSLFIESLLIGLPVPYIFGADISDGEDSGDGRVEIIDGAQRIQTIDAFINSQLILRDMEKIPLLNGKTFNDLSQSRQRRFLRTTIRMIELQNINEDGRRMMFDRLNTGGSKLTDMEKRRGVADSKFLQFIDKLAQEPLIIELTPLAPSKLARREREEYILRFFAYLFNYQNFNKSVQGFLAEFIDLIEPEFHSKESELHEIIIKTFSFVKNNFDCGFKRSKSVSNVSRVRFEAISVGIALAIQENSNLATMKNINVDWAFQDEFLTMIRSDASNSKPKVITRIEYVKNQILGV
ncbi:DUF262 domain-containing protein [Acinetobacter calcoaceticus]|uniref:DUF262 domain-containing protein n=1 Tax=Acinetobacter calcoaceticus TaxID=471 RepID=UPI003A83DB18